ncbi:MAG: transposase [bacterium]|nr:transposase [bacterium]
MSRRGRINLPNYFYHVICRGQRKDKIYLCDEDKIFFLKALSRILRRVDVEIFAFCLMDNHYHLLVKLNRDSIDKLLKPLNTRYAIHFNRKHDLVGHVFQDRAKMLIVLDEKYIISLIKYIHNNPVKKAIVEKAEDYPYSSARFYITDNLNTTGFLKIYEPNKHQVVLNKSYINIREEYIGSTNAFSKIEKRIMTRVNRDDEKRRNCETRKIKSLEYFCQILNIKKDNLIYRTTRKDFAFKLTKMGYNEREIAKLLNLDKTTVCKYLSGEKR